MSITGDFGELDSLIDRFGELERGTPQEALARNLAEESLELVADGFEEGKDPYGGTWPALKARSGEPLRDTAHLQNSWHVHDVQPDQFTIKAGVWYAVVHQDGMTITPKQVNRRGQKRLVFPVFGKTVFAKQVTIPRRQMVPDADDIPVAWRAAWDETAADFFDEFFR
jgi:phage gpG-like protein